MSDFAATQREARSAWLSDFPFESTNGGLGVSLACTTTSGTSSRTALVGIGNTVMLTNTGSVTAYVAFGTSSVVATTAYYPVLPGSKEILSLSDETAPTHVAAITDSGTTTLLVHKGYGN